MSVKIAMVRRVFHEGAEGEGSLAEAVAEAAARGAVLAVFPEIQSDPWICYSKDPVEGSACEGGVRGDEGGDLRIREVCAAAKAAGIAVVASFMVKIETAAESTGAGASGSGKPSDESALGRVAPADAVDSESPAHVRGTYNTSVVVDKEGNIVGTQLKNHLPCEDVSTREQQLRIASGSFR